MFDRFSDHAKQLMSRARLAAIRLRHAAIEPEHLLIALLELPDCRALQVLRQLGVDTETLRHGLETLLPHGIGEPPGGQLPFGPAAKAVLEATFAETVRRGHRHVGSEHLLLGMLSDVGNVAGEVLVKAGVQPQAVADALRDPASPLDRTRLRLLLISNSTMHGGGYLAHCAHEIRNFLGPARRVMFVPYALHDHHGYTAKARDAFAEMGHTLFSVHEHKHSPAALAQCDAVFVGGGNTFRLLGALQHYGLLDAIREAAFAGTPYIGSSAGTNVATLSIRTTNDMPIVQPRTFAALQLVPFQINPHYLDPDPASKHMGETREERIRQFHEEHVTPVLGLREGCLLRVEGASMELRGTTRARLFRRGQAAEEFAPPCDLSFLLRE